MSDFKHAFARNLKYYMRINSLNQKELAVKAGVSPPVVSLWCSAKKVPHSTNIDKLCEVFNCTRADLLLEDEHPVNWSSPVDKEVYIVAEEIIADPELYDLFVVAKESNASDLKFATAFLKGLKKAKK